MAKGIIYLMTTVVSGLIKIGKTGNEQFENMMIRKNLSMIYLAKAEFLILNCLHWI